MFKNLIVPLVFALLQFPDPATAGGEKINLWKNNDKTKCAGQMVGKGFLKFEKAAERFAVGTMFRHEYNESQVGYEAISQDNIPLRIVLPHPTEAVQGHPAENLIQYKELSVKISKTSDDEEIATGSLLALNDKFWTLRFSNSVPQSDKSEGTIGGTSEKAKEMTVSQSDDYLQDLIAKFPVGGLFYPAGNGFDLLQWDQLYGTVEKSEFGYTRINNKSVLVVKFAISKASIVRINETTGNYTVYHMSTLIADNGKLVGNGVKLSKYFKVDDLIQYTSTGEKNSESRRIEESPLRKITKVEEGTNSLEFTKAMVMILYDNGSKEQPGTLFATDPDQTIITVEVACADDVVTKESLKGIITENEKYKVNPRGTGLQAAAMYTAAELIPFNGDEWAPKKRSMRIRFTIG